MSVSYNKSDKNPNFKHGGFGTRLYQIWRDMKQRCYNPNTARYKYYGSKDVQVCPEWLNNFIVFRDWSFLNGYTDNLTIDRINNNGNYEPGNCQWITKSENSKKSCCERWNIQKEKKTK